MTEDIQTEDWAPEVPFEQLVVIGEEIDGLRPPWDSERFLRAVRAAFGEGALAVLCGIIRDRLKAIGVPQREVAEVLGVSAPAVSQWFNGGRISGEHLAGLLLHYDRVLSPLPTQEVRGRKEVGVGGYIEAMLFIRRKVRQDSTCERPITREEFACLERSFTNKAWLEGARELGASQIFAIAEKELAPLGLELRPNAPLVTWIQRLMSAWGWAYLGSVYGMMSVAGPSKGKPESRVAQ
ncbi:MAG: helix-turn-helix domain-containing protein [Gemmataceae bacterium]|nr:helix-turn-helix domain-containing protein [Gemmataceae bacterium]